MANFPSKWFDFLNQKELKRLRRDINNTFWLKIQIVVSLIVAIFPLIFSDNIKALSIECKVVLCVVLSFIIVLVFILPIIIKKLKLLKFNNYIIDGKIATSIFDEEIVYNILVASEFYDIYNSTITNKLSNELKEFYKIETKYYIKTAMEKLITFSSNMVNIIGNKKNQIPPDRVKNITNMIDIIIYNMGLTVEQDILDSYNNFKQNI